jgi:hypothetical protein
MTGQTRALPPAGWYPDHEVAGHLRWWDGYQWTLRKPMPESGAPLSGARKPVGRGFARLSRVLLTLLGLVTVVTFGQLALDIWGYTMIGDAVATGDLDAIHTFDGIDGVLGVLTLVGIVVAGICWMTWQGLLARSAFPGELDRGSGMHAFSWIIPFGALWLPFQNIRDLWRLNSGGRDPGFVGWWWAGWVLTEILARVTIGMANSTDTPADFRGVMVVDGLSCVIAAGTAFLAIRIVRTLTTGGLERADGSPVTPAGSPGAR